MELDELRQEYQALASEAERFRGAMVQEMENLLAKHSVALGVPLESRVKTWDSIAEKADRKAIDIDSVKEIDDLVGIRLIVLFRRDLEKVCHLISETFQVVSEEDAAKRLAEEEFGYQSFHYVVEVPEAWLAIPSFSGFGDLRAEVQVRTLAQHIWAAASHELQYKQQQGVPGPVRRSIHRVSALLETVDLEFERVLAERESYLSSVDERPADEGLNVDLLAHMLDSLLPSANKDQPEPYSELLQDLAAFGITQPPDLESLVSEHLEAALEKDQAIAADKRKRRDFQLTTKERICAGVFFAHVGLVRSMLRSKFGQRFDEYRKMRRHAPS